MTSPGQKLLITFASLLLILACAPSFAVPAPPTLDPHAINLFIAQTANAASTQTMAAQPTLTPTVVTPTPRHTDTPEPTPTPPTVFLFESPTPAAKVQYFRVKHDSQLALYNYRSRTAAQDWGGVGLHTPEVFPLFILPDPTSGTNRTRLDGAWETYINALNNFDQDKLRYLKADNTALFNGAGFPQLESLTMGGNVITLYEIRDGWGRVRTLDYSSPPNANSVNYFTQPDLVHKFVVVVWNKDTKSTYWTNPPKGDLYWPLVSSRPVWIPMNQLEGFPILPMTVTANTVVLIQSRPEKNDAQIIGQLSAGETARIMEYHLSGSSVWGRVAGGGWIVLFHYTSNGPEYPTSWKMETLPPPP